MKSASLAMAFLVSLGNALMASEPVRIDGSSTVYPITKLAAEAFTQSTGRPVEASFSGTTAGFRKLLAGQVDLIGASRPILQAEIEKADADALEFIELPVAYDALTVAVHPDNTWAEDIKVSELKRLWSKEAQGEKTLWSDLREGWPDKPVVLFGAGADSGTFDFFSEVITGQSEGIRSDYVGSEDDEMLVEGISKFPNSLGFVPFAYVSEHPYALKPLAIAWDEDPRTGRQPGGKPVLPSNRALLQGYYIPLGRPLFIYVNKKALEEKPNVEDFLIYLLTEGRRHIRESGYLVLNEPAYLDIARDLRDRVTGTRFGGQIQVGVALHDLILDPK